MIGPYHVYPTTDIHLVAGGPGLELRLFDSRGPTPMTRNWREVTGIGNHVFTPRDPAVVSVSGTRLDPGNVGETTVRVEHVAPPQLRALLRVSVHARIDRIWPGNNQITLHQGSTDYVPTVYGRFTDGVIADITSHPYLSYSVNPSFVGVLFRGDGRLEGRAPTADTPLLIEVRDVPDAVDPISVPVRVIDPETELSPSLVPLHGSGNDPTRRNLLLIAEGFSASDMPLLRVLAGDIAFRIFRSPSHSPFLLLQRRFNAWLGLQFSPERAITIGPPVTILRAAAEPVDLTSTTALPAQSRLMQARDSYFGLMYGARLGDSQSQPFEGTNSAADLARWLRPRRVPRSISPDFRRLADPATDPVESFRAKLDSWFDLLGAQGQSWKTGGRDAGLVCFLVNDDVRGGSGLPDDTTVAMTVGNWHFYLAPLSGDPLDPARDPPWDHDARATLQTETVGQPPNQRQRIAGNAIEGLTSRIVHELGHTPVFMLGDEYAEAGHEPQAGGGSDVAEIEQYDNLHSFRGGVATLPAADPPAIQPQSIKWNWHRIDGAAVVTARPFEDSGQIVIPIDRALGGFVIGGDNRVFLRQSLVQATTLTRPEVTLPMELVSIDQENEARCRPTDNRPVSDYRLERFDAGSVFYQARRRGGNDLTLIDRNVAADLAANGAFGELTVAQCQAPPAGLDELKGVRLPRPGIANFQYPSVAHQVIGLYEGGGLFRCRAYSPAGFCRMRTSYDDRNLRHVDFCFVCKYIIVDKIDPSSHPFLDDTDYPS